MCLVIVKDDVALSSLDAVKRLSNEQRARQILTENGAIEPGVRRLGNYLVKMSCNVRIPVFRISNPVQNKQAWTVTGVRNFRITEKRVYCTIHVAKIKQFLHS